jgi:uncharacterized protein (DUF983 family)
MQNSADPESNFERWSQAARPAPPEWDMPGWGETIKRGLFGRCPSCNATPIFDGYLKVHDKCGNCAAPLGDMPADDAPPYIAMLVVLHFLAFFLVIFYHGGYRPGVVMSAVLLILLALLCMAALRMAKGAVIGILLKLGLRREKLG